MSIFSATISGNLVSDAERKSANVKSETNENSKDVISFTIATNLNREDPIYTNVEYWVSSAYGKIEDRLKKGNVVTVLCNSRKDSKWADKDDPTRMKTRTVYRAHKIQLGQ